LSVILSMWTFNVSPGTAPSTKNGPVACVRRSPSRGTFPQVVSYGGRNIPIAQCNNVYIFPAIGLGVVASRASRVTDSMILAAAQALGDSSPALKDSTAPVLPALTDIRQVAAQIAWAVGWEAQQAGVAPRTTEEELRRRVVACQWAPAYPAMTTT
jgi:malate dehydrogenase (oxaloacetate-decarboxylating)